MKIAILGTSGSGKSTLAQTLGATYHAPVLHLDTHESWIIDGNYTKTCYDQRLEEADQIIVLCFDRFTCLSRVLKRWWKNRGKVRSSSAPGCEEKIDAEFLWWVLHQGRTPAKLAGYRRIGQQYPEKFVFLKNQSQLERFLSSGSYSL